MTREQIVSQLSTIFATVLGLRQEDVVPDLCPDNCEMWDSLHHIHLMSAIDETFALHLDIEKQIEILTFDLAVEIVCLALVDGGRTVHGGAPEGVS